MKHLFLHIGLGKTGSSAIQSWLSLNAETLLGQGIDYADLIPAAKLGEVSSGNGFALYKACVSQDFEEVEKLLTSTYFFNPENNVSIISCELLQGIKLEYVKKLGEICQRNAIEVSVIAYVRSVYEQSYSTYNQGIKRASITHRFGENSTDIGFSKTVEYLKRYLEVFGDGLKVINYDDAKKDIYASFANITGIEIKRTKQLKVKVNRSLTLAEAEVLRRMNSLHNGVFSSKISDFVIGLSPGAKTNILYDEILVRRVRQDTEEDMRWINEQFKLTRPLVSDYYSGQESDNSVLPNRAAYQSVLRWALDYKPCETLLADFECFLKEFAVFLVEISGKDALALINRARGVQREIEAIKVEVMDYPGESELTRDAREDKAIGDELIRERERSMQRYLITYHPDYSLPATEAAGQLSSLFADWFASFSGQIVGSTLNPIDNTYELNSPESEIFRGKASISGFTIVKAEDMAAVLSIVRMCPLLQFGVSVEVSHIVQLYQGEQ